MRNERRTLVLLLIASCSLGSMSTASVFDPIGTISAAGSVDVSLAERILGATLLGTITLDGELLSDGIAIPLASTGTFTGWGGWNPFSFFGEAWAAFETRSEGDAPVTIRGLLYASSARELPLQAGEMVAGLHYMLVHRGGSVLACDGTFSGILTGGIAPVDVPLTLRFVGAASFSFTGEPISQVDLLSVPREIPLDCDRMPAEFLGYLQSLFGWPLDLPVANPEDRAP